MSTRRTRRLFKAQQGFTMVEMLMTAFILAVGIMGLSLLQVMSLKGARGGKSLSTAVQVGDAVMDRIEQEGRLTWLNVTANQYKVPAALTTLRFVMTLDVVLLSSLYTIAFVAALRRVPLFPRLLVAIWAIDIVMQLGIATAVAGTQGLPPTVADALRTLLDGNVKKVLISVCLWLPYLLMSRRVNVTFRHRVEV